MKSDNWFRFEENIFRHKDHFYTRSWKIDKFPSIKEVYRNHIYVPNNHTELEKNRILRIIYRNDENQYIHERVVISIETFLGGIGGLYPLLITIFANVFGGYLKFLSNVRWIKKFNVFKQVCDNYNHHNHDRKS